MYRPVGLLSIQLRCYGMLWFDVPTALLRVQRRAVCLARLSSAASAEGRGRGKVEHGV